jgi:lactate dehydrogenase-like 2-hydroxyacid dehydrogenase
LTGSILESSPNEVSTNGDPNVTLGSPHLAGILYTNGGDSASEAVAEMAMFHIIAVFRNLSMSLLGARSNDPRQWRQTHESVPQTSHNLRGQTVGIIGLGSIGFKIATKAHHGFGMKIHYYDVVRKSQEQEELIKATYAPDLESLVAKADCVVLAAPYGGDKMISAALLAKFQPGARFVNIARGALVDEQALLESVRSGHLHSIGLDVFENEPAINSGFLGLKNALLTTHSAGGSIETFAGFERLSLENVEQFLLHGRALTPVNLHLVNQFVGKSR